MISASEFTEWSAAEWRKFRCGAAASGRRGLVRLRPLSVGNRRHSSGIDRGYPDPIVIDEYIPENNTLYLIPRQLVCRNPVDLFLFQSGKKAFHPGIVKAMSGAAEALLKSCLAECRSERFAGILTSSVTVKDSSVKLLAVLQFKFFYSSDTKLFLHVVIHCNGKNLAVIAIQNGRQV